MAVKYSFFKICIIFNTYFPVIHYFVINKVKSPKYEVLRTKGFISNYKYGKRPKITNTEK